MNRSSTSASLTRRVAAQCSGVLALIGAVALVVTDAAAIAVVEGYNPISETVSQLAVGELGWIQDLGIMLCAVGVMALSIGLFLLRPVLHGRWVFGLLLLFFASVALFLVAGFNQYIEPSVPNAIHFELVLVLVVFFVAAAFLLARGLRRLSVNISRLSLMVGFVVPLLVGLYFFVPSSVIGLYERVVVLFGLIWLVAVALVSFRARRS